MVNMIVQSYLQYLSSMVLVNKLRKSLIPALPAVLLSTTTLLSEPAGDSVVKSPTMAMYFESGGPALSILSGNFEFTLLRLRPWPSTFPIVQSLRVSAGASIVPVSFAYAPFLLKLILFESSSHIEIGGGISLFLFNTTNFDPNDGIRDDFGKKPIISGIVGYRYEPIDGGFMFRVGYTPFYSLATRKYEPIFAIAVGHAF